MVWNNPFAIRRRRRYTCRGTHGNLVEQVLFKRKPVQYLPRPPIEDDSSEARNDDYVNSAPVGGIPTYGGSLQVWVIPETNEVFTSYEPYLQRMDFYKQRRFTCEITGHSGLTFFEALGSEVCTCVAVELFGASTLTSRRWMNPGKSTAHFRTH